MSLTSIPSGLVVRIPGFHPGSLGSTPDMGSNLLSFVGKISTFNLSRNYKLDFVKTELLKKSMAALLKYATPL